ncbi:MAG: hypothetical protein IH827_04700 [Myxococcales bacterium]|nr:hypothetical protein [Myxococcales bacterium]
MTRFVYPILLTDNAPDGILVKFPDFAFAITEGDNVADALTQAALGDKHILWLIDEGTIDAGVSPLIVRMIQRGLVRQVAMTGTAAVRDYELSYHGMTHEEVGPGLEDGRGAGRP